MTAYRIALFLHLLGAVSFFAGMAVAGVGLAAAARRTRPSETALLLHAGRLGLPLVGAGFLLLLGAGLSLVHETGRSLGTPWIAAALGLLIGSALLGGYGGRAPRHARELATRLADEGDDPSAELQTLFLARPALAANTLAALAALAALGLMVWRPGG